MSIGPSEITKIEEMATVTKFSMTAKKAVAQYFVRPAHYLFYMLLTMGALALLIGKEPPIKFWILLAFIGVLNIVRLPAAEEVSPLPKAAKKNSNGKGKQ